MRVDEKGIHLFYRPNCPPKGVKANKVRRTDIIDNYKVVALNNCLSASNYDDCDADCFGLTIQVDHNDPITVQSTDETVVVSHLF